MPIPSSFDAAVTLEKGAHSVVQQRSPPPLEAHEVGIKVTATAINPVDWKIRDYKIFIEHFPFVGGSDGAGEIVELGSDVKGLNIGDRVFFQGILGNNDAATFQQYTKLDSKLVGLTPKNVSDEEAAGIFLATMAALTGLYDTTGSNITPHPWQSGGNTAGKGQAAVIIGGSSSVGQYAIQLARASGFDRIITNSSAKHVDLLTKFGATTVLDRSKSSHEDFIAAIGDIPLGLLFDSIALPDTDVLAAKIAQGVKDVARPRIVSRVSPMPAAEEAQKLAEKEPKVQFKGIFGSGAKKELRYISEPALAWLGGPDGQLAQGGFVPNKPVVVEGGLASLDKAFDKNKAGVSGEKVVIRPFGP